MAEIQTLRAPSCVAVNSKGRLLFTVGYPSECVKVTAVHKPHKVLSSVETGHAGTITCVALDSRDAYMATGSFDCTGIVPCFGLRVRSDIRARCQPQRSCGTTIE